MIPAAVLALIASGCAEQAPMGPEVLTVAPSQSVPVGNFLVAWSQRYIPGPIQSQLFSLDVRQNRQYGEWYADPTLLAFARANPGRLYIHGDEPDQGCVPPSDYAVMYYEFVTAVRSADPTARFSPAGVAEPNWHCCPLPDDVPAPCWSSKHSIGYMDQFYNAYLQRYKVPPPVNEWRFHDFGIAFVTGDMEGWWGRVNAEAAWSVAHGANMVLGSWGFLGWKESDAAYSEHMKVAMGRLMNDPRINEAAYWAYQFWAGEAHFLTNPDGSLTPEGVTYANPLSDIPTGIKIVGAANGRAGLQWTNTTSAWSAEVEYWVQPAGASAFIYSNTQLVRSAGATQTPQGVFHIGDVVKGRVRYYNPYGQAAWSPFSNTAVMAWNDPGSSKGSGSKSSPRFCFLPLGVQSQSCD